MTMPRLSIVLDATIPTDDFARSLASVRAQRCESWELLVVGGHCPPEQRALLNGDARIHVIPTDTSDTAALNAALRAARGESIAWCTAGSEWPVTRADEYLAILSGNGADVCVATLHGGAGDMMDGPLAALCVEEAMVESSLVFRRDLLGAVGLLDERLTFGAWWELSLRLMRAGTPRFLTAAPDALEREVTLDLLPRLLIDVLQVHARVADLAVELPDVRLRQATFREQLFEHLAGALPVLVDALGAEAVAAQLCDLTDAVLACGADRDRADLRVLLRAAERAGVRDLALHHRRLMLLRAMGQADAVVLACQSGGFPLDQPQLAELVQALRVLGAVDDADRVAATMPEVSLQLPPLPDLSPRIPGDAFDPERYAGFPRWLTAVSAGERGWGDAADAYDSMSLTAAARTARERSVRGALTDDTQLGIGLADPIIATTWDGLDTALAAALRTAAVPLLPVPVRSASARYRLLEAGGAQLRPGAMGDTLLQSLLTIETDDPLDALLSRYPEPVGLVDLAPALGTRAVRLLAANQSARCVLFAAHALHGARLTRAVAFAGARAHVSVTTADLIEAMRAVSLPLLVHAPLRREVLPQVQSLLNAMRSMSPTMSVVWTGTDVPCVWEDAEIQECIHVIGALGLATMARVRSGDGLITLSLADAPRAHLLISEGTHAIA